MYDAKQEAYSAWYSSQCGSFGSNCACSGWGTKGLLCCMGVVWWTHQEFSKTLHLFTKVVGYTNSLDLWCDTVNSCSLVPGGGLVVASAKKALHLCSQFDSKSVVSSSSLLCLVSLSQGVILWPSGLPTSCVCFLNLPHKGVLILWVCFLYF